MSDVGSRTEGEGARPTRLFYVRSTPRCGPAPALRPTFGCVPTTALSMGNKVRGQKGWNSLNQLISPCDEERRHFEANRFCGLEIDHQLELRRLLHREVGGLGALQDLVHKHGAAPEEIEKAWPVRHETAGFHTLPDAVYCRQAAPCREVCDPCSVGVEHRI